MNEQDRLVTAPKALENVVQKVQRSLALQRQQIAEAKKVIRQNQEPPTHEERNGALVKSQTSRLSLPTNVLMQQRAWCGMNLEALRELFPQEGMER